MFALFMAFLQWHKVYKSSKDQLHRPPAVALIVISLKLVKVAKVDVWQDPCNLSMDVC